MQHSRRIDAKPRGGSLIRTGTFINAEARRKR
jgi:hypothetical protein